MANLIFLQGFFAFLFGTILGSFLNALLFRYRTGVGMGGRSRCMRCGHTLQSLDLVPILSYLFLRGRCRYCHSRISPQYPLVELAAGLLSLGVFLLYPAEPLFFGFGLLVWMTLLFIVVYDTEHTVVPLEALGLMGALGFFSLFFSCTEMCAVGYPGGWALSAGLFVSAPLLFLSAVSRGRWMGWGDGLLMIPLGWLLGISGGYTALVLAFWSGAIVGLVLMGWSAWRRKKVTPMARAGALVSGFTMSTEVPFAPFLVLGAFAVYFFHVDIFQPLVFL